MLPIRAMYMYLSGLVFFHHQHPKKEFLTLFVASLISRYYILLKSSWWNMNNILLTSSKNVDSEGEHIHEEIFVNTAYDYIFASNHI